MAMKMPIQTTMRRTTMTALKMWRPVLSNMDPMTWVAETCEGQHCLWVFTD